MGNAKVLFIAAQVLGSITLAFIATALASKKWATESGSINADVGLFRIKRNGEESDVDYPNSEDDQKNNATIAFAFLALFAALAGTILAAMKNAKAHIPFFVASICGLIATAIYASIYTDYLKDLNFDLDFAFIIFTVAWILALFGGIAAFLASSKE